jgi:hypothetical protein
LEYTEKWSLLATATNAISAAIAESEINVMDLVCHVCGYILISREQLHFKETIYIRKSKTALSGNYI